MLIRTLLFCLLAGSFVVGDEDISQLKDGEFEMLVMNRVVAQANGKPITALDVFKRMDFLFYRQYPEHFSSLTARYEYYKLSWKEVLEELVDRELMRADAVEMKIEITPSEVRQELEQTFGPDIINNLDKIGLRLDEAMKMLKDELVIRRVMMFKVNSKAFRAVGPMEIKNAYESWAASHRIPERWRYRVITLRGPNESEGMKAAEEVRKALLEGRSLEVVRDEFIKEEIIPPSITFTVSDSYLHPQEEVPQLIFSHLSSLQNGETSEPFAQLSRKTGEVAVRLALLEEKVAPSVTPLKEIEVQLKNQLISKEIEEESKKYMANLREQYHVSNDRNEDLALPLRIIPKI